MGAGLDELIESLVTDIAFSGVRGCSVSNLLVAINSFYKSSERGDESQETTNDHDLAVASKVWKWLADRSDVSIGVNREFNHLSLEQALALPEEEEPPSSGTAVEASDKASHPGPSLYSSKGRSSTVRPRLHVSEERQWRTIAGHGPDLKRVPLFEWRALVDIASVREKGILQGDLVRLTGQDKRSLPTRTDALARKGYIIKQPIVLRGGKSSKLWLAQFSEYAKEHQEQEGLDYDRLDLSKAALTSDLQPVPFCHKWNGETIDYLALAQAFVAIVKAWALIRYCDARAKLGVEERVRQMRALAKTCRWLTNIGALSFVGAKFAGSNRLFKDCVKYIRDPSPAEWSHFRATPKARMVVPSGRIGKRGEASRAVHASQPGGSRGKAAGKRQHETKFPYDALSHTSTIPPPWKPQKPVPNTAFEIIKRAGPQGTSNAVICRQTLGPNFRRLTAAMTGSISMPTNSQPPHLKHLSSTSQLSRIGKTLTYTFYANTEIVDTRLDEQPAQVSIGDTSTVGLTNTGNGTAENPYDNAFSKPDLSRFATYPGSSLAEIAQTQRPSRVVSTTLKRKRPMREELDDQPCAKIHKRLGRPPKKLLLDATSSAPAEEHRRPKTGDTPSTAQPATIDQQSPPGPPPRPPGVYRGLPNSLNPIPKRKGRRPRSLVIIFRSDKLKDPSFLGAPSVTSEVDVAKNSSSEAATKNPSLTIPPVQVEQEKSVDTMMTPGTASEPLHVDSKKPKAGKNGAFWCEKCGNSWKNSNGLEYHLTKSRTTCNPDFVPPPIELTNHRSKPTQPKVSERASRSRVVPDEPGQHRQTLTPREQKESRFGGEKRSLASRPQKPSAISSPSDESTACVPNIAVDAPYQAARSSIILKDLDVYDATDHQRFLRQSKPAVNSEVSAHRENGSGTHSQQPPLRNKLPFNASATTSGELLGPDVRYLGEQESSLDHPPNTRTEQTQSLIDEQAFPATTSTVEQTGMSEESLRMTTSIARSRIRKPLPTIPSEKLKDTSPSISTPTTLPTTAQEASLPELHSEPLFNNGSAQQSKRKSLAFFARPTRQNASFGARRRNRTMQIIEYLLEQNEGVFPGLRSVFMAVISVWAKEFQDLAPPDRRICQNAVNQMEREAILKQMHFFFFDDEAKMQECVVLVKADTNSGRTVDTSDDPRVIAVKEKMREMFPEAYVPDAFSLSPDEAKLFGELASQGKEHSQPRNLKVPRDLRKVQDIETLRYENSVMDDISLHRSNAKRQVDDSQVDTSPPSKRARIDVEHSDLFVRNRKPRRRPDKHEMWDSGKLAVYIWSQRQKPDAMWEQNRSCLQDPTNGTWSWTPGTDSSQLGNITTILSSVKSTRQIDASLKRKGRKRLAGTDPNARARRKYKNASQHDELAIPTSGLRVFHEDQHDGSSTQFFGTPAAISLASYSLTSDEATEDMFEDNSDISDHDSVLSSTSSVEFTPGEVLGDVRFQDLLLDTQDAANSASARPMQSTLQLSRENPPRNVQDILKTAPRVHSFRRWADPAYGQFLRNIKTIKRWEQSSDGISVLNQGTIAPDFVYISLTPGERTGDPKPINLEWLGSNQFTPDSVPDEIKNASLADEEYGLSHLVMESRKMGKQSANKSEFNTARHRETDNGGRKLKSGSRRYFGRVHATLPQYSMSPAKSEGFIEYKTRDLTTIPKQPRGRVNKPATFDDKLSSKREDELIAACVVFRTLLGGLDRSLDIGLLLKYYPGISLSALKKFWPRVSRERKSYVQALTAKFQSAFLMAYESGKLPPLDYDDIENYDWPKVILWATQLETHEDVDLPESRDALHQTHLVEEVANETVDWRETWFANTSSYNRIEAVASETMSIPLPPKHQQDKAVLERARTWVRSICCTSLRGVNVRDKLIPRLLELGNGDAAETNQILNKVVARLNREKIITRTKGKDLGGNFRINGMFSKQLEKMACTPKFRQAIAFKAQLDEVFRLTDEYILPYASDDGSIMAALNLQAHGRIRMDAVDMPNIPFGFEPGNYEGRTFPKSYYHFKVRIVPTETYLFNDDMALLRQAQRMEPPIEGPGGKIPIWVDFFGNVNTTRWADYISMIAITLAMKGPIAPQMCVTLLKPMIDEFEVQLIVDWLDKLGLIQQAVHGCGVTAAEWWWLVAGHVVQASDKGPGENRVLE
ncbi:hypothetical protein F5B17DRAFT_122953 [Nemania serpens]|nr:hypothetical protein F5B17DRAFT_122953 [Nemania serpens]